MDETWELYEELKDAIGEETLLEGIARALGDDELRECVEFVARMEGIDLKGGDER